MRIDRRSGRISALEVRRRRHRGSAAGNRVLDVPAVAGRFPGRHSRVDQQREIARIGSAGLRVIDRNRAIEAIAARTGDRRGQQRAKQQRDRNPNRSHLYPKEQSTLFVGAVEPVAVVVAAILIAFAKFKPFAISTLAPLLAGSGRIATGVVVPSVTVPLVSNTWM